MFMVIVIQQGTFAVKCFCQHDGSKSSHSFRKFFILFFIDNIYQAKDDKV